MRNWKDGVAIAITAFTIAGILAIVFAVEIGLLLLLGLTYTSWQALALFIGVMSVVELILTIVWKGFINQTAQRTVHQFWGQLILSFTLLMSLVRTMEAITLPMSGAIIYAVLSAIIYTWLERDRSEAK